MVYLQETWVRSGWSVHISTHSLLIPEGLSLSASCQQAAGYGVHNLDSQGEQTWGKPVTAGNRQDTNDGHKRGAHCSSPQNTIPTPRYRTRIHNTHMNIHYGIIYYSKKLARHWEQFIFVKRRMYTYVWVFYIVECIRHGSVPDQD